MSRALDTPLARLRSDAVDVVLQLVVSVEMPAV